ncbi:hypothetical protein PPERSA_10671 [Pseudocohnilembus persalinus]|uniref:Uncharacterized protein n=1 Tax=Pseudocohnilembus persalinus TaxID=266149 RepID=A0A0V0QD97_PSEPJ|nr:hypothetical protein PPERSA_10671 [Pseudocohnilembus persalinus]|eukprot:KRX00172.1 hypothetical protein PPERSA_10671 [Pseudocohnilembus persalinus]
MQTDYIWLRTVPQADHNSQQRQIYDYITQDSWKLKSSIIKNHIQNSAESNNYKKQMRENQNLYQYEILTHGFNYLYSHVPNKVERLEMIWRSIGKQYDFDYEKFRLSKKSIDKGNKRRWFKNVLRLAKHPAGYLYWKTYKFRQAKASLIVTCLGIGFTSMFIKMKMQSMRNAKKNHFLLRSGKNIEGSGPNYLGYHDNQLPTMSMPLTQWLYHPLAGHKIVTNPCRDQNYRKYFELRKRNGIKPPGYSE